MATTEAVGSSGEGPVLGAEAVATEATVGIGKGRWQRRPVGTEGMAMAKTEAVATGQCWEGSKGADGGQC